MGIETKKYKCFSLFSGVGGSSLGYKMGGFDVVGSVEFVEHQAHNYRLNHTDAKVFECDIRKLEVKDVLEQLNIKKYELDLLDGSPPCSSFSTCGQRDKGWGKTKQYSNKEQRTDDLFFEYIRFVKEIQPKVFVAENVSGLAKGVAKGYLKNVFNLLSDCGYNVKVKILNAKYYGVPQSRERLFIIGVRKDLEIQPSYPIPNNKIVNLNEAFKDLPIENKIQSDELEKEALRYKDGWLKWLRKLPKSPNRVLKGSSVHPNKSYFNLSRLSMNAPSDTICQINGQSSASGNCHPIKDRKLTIYELKRITSFPDDFILEGTFAQQWEACGRTVPPLLMKAIASNIITNILDKIGE